MFVSFSGGKDSTVLLDLVRRIYPEVPAVFVNTGLEYPEIRDFVKSIDNVVWLKPKMNFVEVIKKYGYPLIGKEAALYIRYAKKGSSWALNYLDGKNSDGSQSSFKSRYKKYQFLISCDFNISNQCCETMKEKPLNNFMKELKKYPINGTMTEESSRRRNSWLKTGCNAFNSSLKISKPLSFWTEQDILAYIKKYNIPYASIYGELIKNNNRLKFTGCQRTGCVFCGFGCQCEKSPNRFQKMAQTHPQLYDYCMRGGKYDETGHWVPDKGLGMAKVLDAINVQWWNTEEEKDKYRKAYQEKEKEYYNKSEE